MEKVVVVKFKGNCKPYYFSAGKATPARGQGVIVETARGPEYAVVVNPQKEVENGEIVSPLKPILRIATEKDEETVRRNEERRGEAMKICKEKIRKHGLEMKLIDCEFTFDGSKVVFTFTAEGRVDFRELVKDLASIFRTRIELRQIGVRDEAKMLGGLGICGRELCCTSYLEEFQPVSINMAKEQNLSLNPSKISGTCGRLMCCLKYEHEVYSELQKQTPKPESLVDTPDGRGTVVSTQMLRGTCRVLLEDGDGTPQQYPCTECSVLRSGRAKGRPAPLSAQTTIENDDPRPMRRKPYKERPIELPTEDFFEEDDHPHRKRRRGGTRRHRGAIPSEQDDI